jgi:hypothetical protein
VPDEVVGLGSDYSRLTGAEIRSIVRQCSLTCPIAHVVPFRQGYRHGLQLSYWDFPLILGYTRMLAFAIGNSASRQ